MYTVRKQRRLDSNNEVQMDAFNEEYAEACKKLGVSRETLDVTFAQAGEYLGLSSMTVMRYCYAVPPVLELSHVLVDDSRYTHEQRRAMVTLDSVVEYKLGPRFNLGIPRSKKGVAK